jgi:chromosome segregation ATPase
MPASASERNDTKRNGTKQNIVTLHNREVMNMPRKPSVTQEEVDAAADQISASGQIPTTKAIQQLLGKGRAGTVQKLLRNWQAAQLQRPETPIALPQGLQNVLVSFISQEVASAKAAVEAELSTEKETNADLIEESERQAETIEANMEEIESLVAKQSVLNGRMDQLVADLEHARKEAAEQRQSAESARTEQAKLQFRLDDIPHFKSDIEHLQEELEAERVARVKSEQDAAVAIARLEKTEAQVQDLQIRLARAEAEVTQSKDAATALWGQLLEAKANTN